MAQRLSLLEQVRRCLRLKHYSIRTERAYVDWIKRFILYHGKRHPQEMGTDEIRQFLSHLARLQLTLPDGKGDKDRVTVLPQSLVQALGRQMERARALHELGSHEGFERVHLSYVLARKYPAAERA